MRKLLIILVVAALVGCKDKSTPSPVDEAKKVLVSALTALKNNNIDSYLRHADFGDNPIDSATTSALRQVLTLHLAAQRAERPPVANINVVDAALENDSVCTLLYSFTYADSTKEVMSQKMVKTRGVWKLRLRE